MQTQPFFRTQKSLDAASDNDGQTPDGGMRRIVLMLFLGMVALVTGCAHLVGIKQNPDISLADIELVELGLLEQRFNLKLRIQNPNDVVLSINGMIIEIELNGATFAKGLSDKVVIVPRLGETMMEVKATSTLGTVWKQLVESQKSNRDKVDYRLSGRLFLQGLGSVPFEQKGNVSMPNSVDELNYHRQSRRLISVSPSKGQELAPPKGGIIYQA